jgi:RND superfamily putative drug exporter
MNRIFVLLGHASVRFRFLIVAAWIVITVVAVQTLPSLASVAKDTTSGFLPADVPSMQASTLAAPFQDSSLAAATLIAARDGGLTAADNNAIDTILTKIRTVDHVKVVVDLGISSDGAARQALVEADVPQFSAGGGSPGEAVVAAIRSLETAGAPAGLQVHLTG